MPKPTLRYDKMVEDALRSVVRDSLVIAAAHGLPGAHHFYITFKTEFPGVEIPESLKAQYPSEMTIVLQDQFWGLEVDDHGFAVTLSFHSQAQRLVVPLAAVTAFADPSVKFGLEFRAEDGESAAAPPSPPLALAPTPRNEEPTAPDKPAEVVRLDSFRKKER
jgi:hypothetical protein